MSYSDDAGVASKQPSGVVAASRDGGGGVEQLEGLHFPSEERDSGLAEVVGRARMAPRLSVVTTSRPRKAPRRKPGKKDRHSKIPTAKGMRDRRMRLSLDIARKFFNLQDMLGYDKASKTVKWLMDNAQPAIKQLGMSASLPAERILLEAQRQVLTDSKGTSEHAYDSTKGKATSGRGGERGPSHKGTVASLRRVVSLRTAKESREKARARARERTREKKLKKRLEETAEDEEIRSKTFYSSSEFVAQLPELSCRSQENQEYSVSINDTIQDSLLSIFDYSDNCNLLLTHHHGSDTVGLTDHLLGNWDPDDFVKSSASFSLLNMHSPSQFTDVHYFPKHWEFARH